MKTQRVELTVAERDREHRFSFLAHYSEMPSERQIEPEFYVGKDGGSTLGGGPHYELEILVPAQKWSNAARIHWHTSTINHRQFVCFTGQLGTEGQVRAALEIWGCGVVYSELKGKDFCPEGELPYNFLEILAKELSVAPVTKRRRSLPAAFLCAHRVRFKAPLP